MARNDWFLQCQANLLGLPVLRAAHSESTALGAAFLAALGAGLVRDESALRGVLAGATRFDPTLPAADREARVATWRKAVRAVIGFYT
ncbi:Glycerol kinase [Fimbriiglobus ruber]|uniref:Glycerol kinase n=1 Tax=Fimbriiglobus ruber TaxID=1908690 RepID=A0A225D4M1_9BACT|nr:Glycerol kinase [Fimbriiglobus ruber]